VAAGFFVDENDLALGRALAQRHGDVVFPGHAAIPDVPRQSRDDVGLAVVGERRLVVITRDQRIRYRTVEKQRWIEYAVRGFVLTGTTSRTTAKPGRLDPALGRHRAHGRVAADGPWMFAVTKAGLREIDLQTGAR
jgi:hypothetical protein